MGFPMNQAKDKEKEIDERLEKLAQKYPEGIPADEYLAASWKPEYDQIGREADSLFAKLNDGTQSEDDIWAEVWRIMNSKKTP